MKKIYFYLNLFTVDRKIFWHQLWMVYNRYKINTYKWLFLKISKRKGFFITAHERPIFTNLINTWSDQLVEYPQIAIIIQGPIKSDLDFTLETVKLYRKNFNDTTIIVSTWDTEDEKSVQEIRSLGVEVILNKKPSLPGIGNINLQLVSSLAGIKRAQELGVEYVYKTRTDQRMYGVNINEFLINLLRVFPVKSGFKQHERIIASSFLSQKYVPYLITDMFQFGYIEDMIQYWSTTHDTRTALLKIPLTSQDVMDARISESYLCSEFLTSVGREVTWTIEDSWHAYADHFCIVDKETLDLFWYKYDFYHEYQKKRYDGIGNDQLLTFAEWFNLYSAFQNKAHIPEHARTLARSDYLPVNS